MLLEQTGWWVPAGQVVGMVTLQAHSELDMDVGLVLFDTEGGTLLVLSVSGPVLDMEVALEQLDLVGSAGVEVDVLLDLWLDMTEWVLLGDQEVKVDVEVLFLTLLQHKVELTLAAM